MALASPKQFWHLFLMANQGFIFSFLHLGQ